MNANDDQPDDPIDNADLQNATPEPAPKRRKTTSDSQTDKTKGTEMGTQYCTGDLPEVWRPNGAKTPNHFNIENCGDKQYTGWYFIEYTNYDRL